MKRLIFSDLHLSNWSYGSTVNEHGYNSRLWAQKEALDEIVQYTEEHSIRYAYFAGDLFHKHSVIPTQAAIVASNFFRALRDQGVKIRGIAGNHDFDNRSGSINAVTPFLTPEEMKGTWNDDGLIVNALPYTEDEEILKRFLGNAPLKSMLLLHQGVAGVPLSSGYVLDEKLTPELIPDTCVAFSGHYHYHKRVSPRLTVIGNLTALNWSDIDQPKGFVVYDDETKEIEQVLQRSAPAFISWSEQIDEYSDLTNVEGAFVRYTDEIKPTDQEGIRQALIKEGALTVEFPKIEIEAGTSEIRTGEEVTVEHLVKSFELKDMEPRRIEVGLEIREERYDCR